MSCMNVRLNDERSQPNPQVLPFLLPLKRDSMFCTENDMLDCKKFVFTSSESEKLFLVHAASIN